jgi:hydrophobe/amphiphile efflux-1 (HAE1) family protein
VNVSEPFVRRPVATSLLAAALLLSGLAAFTQLPVAPLPRVDFPTINTSAGLPGASPETMASAVATPLERRFGRIAGLTEITSNSTLGQTSLTLQFDLDRDVDAAARDVQAAINAAGGDLPANLPSRPNWKKVNPADAPVIIVAVTSKTLPLSEIFDAANTVLAQKLSQVPGVGQVNVGGGQQPAVRVRADTAALAGLGLALEDVRAVLAQATVASPKGAISGPAQVQTVAADDQLLRAASYRSLVVAWRNGAPVRLSEVADVIDDVENQRAAAWVDGQRAVLLIVRRQPGANVIEVIERVKALVPTLARSIAPGIDLRVAVDRSQTIRASVADVEFTLVLAVVLVTLVVFVFLRSLRATLIPGVVVPLSLIGTFGAMYLLGYSLDNLSLMALTISTGFVVDDAIVVTENVARHVERGMKPFDAALLGAKEIGFTIVSITVSLLAVFIPILLMGGIIGRLFRSFAVTLSISIAISAVLSLTLTPMMASRLLRVEQPGTGGGAASALSRWVEGLFDRLARAYSRALDLVLRHRTLTLVVTVATMATTVWLYVVVPKGLFPQQDTGQISGFTDAPQDISFPAMRDRQSGLNAVLLAHPAIAHVVSFMGQGNTGTVFIELKPLGQRKQTSEEVIAELRPKLIQTSGIALYLQSVQDVRMGARVGRTQYQYTLQDANLDELLVWAPRMLEALKALPTLRDVTSDQQTAGLQLSVQIDRDTAGRLGVTPAEIDANLYDAFGQRQVATMYGAMNQYRVVLESRSALAARPEALEQVWVRGATGLVPLSAVARWKPTATSLSVNHQGQFPSVTLSFNLPPGVALGTGVAKIHEVEAKLGLPASVHAGFSGTAQAFADSLASQPLLILFALVAVYIVLGVLYESLIHPVTILSTLPPAGVGALLALQLAGMELSIIALVGIILLIGIVKKNAILMIDFAIEAERSRGLPPLEAIREACLLRFRPILMTTLAALLGGVPLAIGTGVGAELRRPLGITIVGGLLLSQLLTLFTTPVVYLALDRFARRKREPLRPPTPTVRTDQPAAAAH